MHNKLVEYIAGVGCWFSDAYSSEEIAHVLYNITGVNEDVVSEESVDKVRYLFNMDNPEVDDKVIMDCLVYTHRLRKRESKELLIADICKPEETPGYNIMGCSESWYDPYYCIQQTFMRDMLESMSLTEIHHLIELAENITDALY